MKNEFKASFILRDVFFFTALAGKPAAAAKRCVSLWMSAAASLRAAVLIDARPRSFDVWDDEMADWVRRLITTVSYHKHTLLQSARVRRERLRRPCDMSGIGEEAWAERRAENVTKSNTLRLFQTEGNPLKTNIRELSFCYRKMIN